jgi:transcriptional regulator with XRE-family HTH domain
VRSIATLRRRTQADLADSLGLSRQAIVRRMNGTTPFSEPELRNLATYLSVPVGAFFGEAVAS